MPIGLCPLILQPAPKAAHPPLPPEKLAYSFTVPGEPEAVGIARDNARTSLRAHGLKDIEIPALQIVGELTAAAAHFAPSQSLYISIRWREGSLRTIVWDPHPRTHHDPDDTRTCVSHRTRLLLLLGCVVRECEGTWGLSEPGETSEGTRVWTDIPRAGATSYALRQF
ncbi:ATP-binding protein [Streptomyces olivoreticuli]|uniref:ATP-binding protein n=1 Tax=Streptomyces olivoreticuli TaxID=68246 RepID=UPI00265B6FF7|nr:ATP-binding protein [Streptomyces olivoreticuli]WKK22109.1 ATP-binding protein [Streptomyces olivoreticuli]